MTAPPILIAQISDLHIKRPGELAYGHVDTAAALSRCVDELNRFSPRPDLIVISGDLVDTPAKEEYDHLRTLLAPLEIPFVAIPGNHDDRGWMRAALPEQPYVQPDGALNLATSCWRSRYRVARLQAFPALRMGCSMPTHCAGLMRSLGGTPKRPAVLFLHHPPFATGIMHMDVQNLRNAADLAAVLRRHKRTRLIAAGHVHRSVLTMFAGVAATICPAPNHAVALDLDARMPPSFRIEPPAFHLHAWFPDNDFGNVVTHFVPIGNFDGPHPFFGRDGRLL